MITPEIIAAGGILGALAIAVFRLLQADPPLARAVQTAERREKEAEMEREVLKRENARLTEELSLVRTQLAVARAWVRFHYGADVESMDLTWLEDEVPGDG